MQWGSWRAALLIVGATLLQSALIVALLVQGRRRRHLQAQRKRAEAECQHQRQQLMHLTRVAILGQLSGALAHELNQPLTSILSNAQAARHLLAADRLDREELQQILEDIVAEDKRAGEVIHRLRAMLKRGEIQVQRVDIAQLIRDVLILAHSDMLVRGIDCATESGLGTIHVMGDRIQLQQVLLNLLLNAAEAMSANEPHDRKLIIISDRDGRLAHIAVRDSGPGIAADRLEDVFDAFYTTKSDGLGLGLSICRSIIGVHGGRIWATNNPGRGATFHFTLGIALGEAADDRGRG